MSYTPTDWKNGDIITEERLDHMEQGIADANSGGGVLTVHDIEGTLDKTWQEIHDALLSGGAVAVYENDGIAVFVFAGSNGSEYHVDTVIGYEYYTETTDGYPACRGED